MSIKLIFDLSIVDAYHHNNNNNNNNKEKKFSNEEEEEEESTESTCYGDDCKAIDSFFDDESSSMCSSCSSSSDASMVSCEYDDTYKRTFGDEDSLVLAKGRYPQQEEPELEELEEEPQQTPSISLASSSPCQVYELLLQAESILDRRPLVDVPKQDLVFNMDSILRFSMNRRFPQGVVDHDDDVDDVDLQKERTVSDPVDYSSFVTEREKN